MKRTLDMSGSTLRGGITPTRWNKSLCESCFYPLGKCQWLLHGKPFAGSEYYEHDVAYDGESVYTVYSIAKCPHYKGEK